MEKEGGLYFLLPFLLMTLFLHLRDWNWGRKDLQYSPGKSLTTEIKPILGSASLYGYRLDIGTMEEINFYLDPDRPIPRLKRPEDLSRFLKTERARPWS